MRLIDGEAILIESPGKTLVLTTHRVRYHAQSSMHAQLQSIMLDELASCSMLRVSNPLLLILAALSLLIGLGLAANEGELFGLIIGALVGGVLFVIYSQTRQEILSLGSAGTTILASTKGMSQEAVKEFIDRIEAAKNARHLRDGRWPASSVARVDVHTLTAR